MIRWPVRLLPASVFALLFSGAVIANPVKFDIPAQATSSALLAFSEQADVQVLFPHNELSAIQSPAVVGEIEPVEALAKLLAGTGYAASQQGPRKYLVAREKMVTGLVRGNLAGVDRRPVEGVAVRVRESGESAFTDRNGEYVFPSLAPGNYTLIASAEGYQTLHITDVRVRAGREVILGRQAMRRLAPTDDVTKMEPYVVQADNVTELDPFEVTDRKMEAFVDRNVDLPRGINDVQAYHIFDSRTILQSGAVNTEDFLKQRLSMNTQVQSLGQGYANSYGTTSSINLRGAGLAETLILVNGRERAGVSRSTTIGQPDLNGIPLEAIDRIEVLPSSASAIYGGNAIGGVVNVILKSNYQGGSLKMTYENTVDSDAPIRSATLTYGATLEGGKTQISLVARYSDGQGVYSKDRLDLAQRGIRQILNNQPANIAGTTLPFYGGAMPNITLYPGAFAPPGGATYVNPSSTSLVLDNGMSLNARITSVPVETAPGSNASAGLLANAGSYNTDLGPNTSSYGLNSLIGWAAPRAKALMGTVNRRMLPGLDAYAEYSMEGNIAITTYAPLTFYRMAGNAPNNPFQQNIYVSLPANLNKPDINNTITRTITAGLKADLPGDWKAQMDYTWSRSTFTLDFVYMDSSGIEGALQSGAINPFVDAIKYPLDMDPYTAPGHWDYATITKNAAVRFSGPVGHYTWGSPNLTAGLQWKEQGLSNGSVFVHYPWTPASNQIVDYFAHAGSTQSAYAEGSIPLVSAKNARPFLRELEFQVAARADYYDIDTGTSYSLTYPDRVPLAVTYYPANPSNTPYDSSSKFHSVNPTVGFKYSPTDSITGRISYATAFLPPTFTQLVPSLAPNSFPTTITDPKTNKTYGVFTRSGGNPDLKPKRSKSLTAGIIWEPKKIEALRGFRADLEYYKITQFDYITILTAQQIVSGDEYADRITRDSNTGLITVVDTSYLNVNEYETNGFDLTLSLHKPTSIGTFDLNAAGTMVLHDRRQLAPGTPYYEYVGYVPEGGPGKYKGNATLTWQKRSFLLGWTATYYDKYYQYAAAGGPYSQRTGVYTYYTGAQGANSIPSQMYHDVFATYVFPGRARSGSLAGPGDSLRRRIMAGALNGMTLQFGVKNVFNKVPPFDAFYSPFFYSPYGNPRLRSYWLSVQKEF